MKYLVLNNKDLIFTNLYDIYRLNSLKCKLSCACNNVKKVDCRDLRSHFITFINIHLMKVCVGFVFNMYQLLYKLLV